MSAFRDITTAGASDDAAGMVSASAAYPMLLVDDRRATRRKTRIVAVILLALCFLSLFVDAGYGTFFDPVEMFRCYGIALGNLMSGTAGDMSNTAAIVFAHPAYFRIINRIPISLMTALCGAVLAIAGSLYQSAFKNPIASPSMLGISSAIQLGDALLVMLYGTAASGMLGMRYLVCYLCVIVVVSLLFVCGKLIGGKGRPFNILNLLLIATILNQLVGMIVTYITYYRFTDEMWDIYTQLSEALTVNLDALSWAVLCITCAVALVPVVLLRFRLNGLNFNEEDMRIAGCDRMRLAAVALVSATMLLMASQVQMGTVAMVSLVVPHISRMVFGAEFRKQLYGNVFIGASLLVACRIVVGFVPVVSDILPVSTVLNFLVLPFFVWMLATQQRGWEQ